MTSFPTENAVDALGLLLTRYCPAACAHCGSSSSPQERGWMAPDLAKELLRSAKRAGITKVLFSGGEPLARFNHALPIISAAAEEGLEVSVCSNGNWARDEHQARRRVGELVAAGTTSLLLSTDRWHLDFIPLEAVINASRAAAGAGIKVQISVPSGAGDFQAISLASTLAVRTGVDVVSHPVHPVGRGAQLPLRTLGVTPPDLGGCHLVGHVEVDVDGTVSICPTSAEFGSSSPLILGDANQSDLEHLINNFRRTPWFAIIRLWGPLGAHLLAGGTRDLSDRSAKAALHPCHLCAEVNGSSRSADAASQRLGVDLMAPASRAQFAQTLASAAQEIAQTFQNFEQLVEIK